MAESFLAEASFFPRFGTSLNPKIVKSIHRILDCSTEDSCFATSVSSNIPSYGHHCSSPQILAKLWNGSRGLGVRTPYKSDKCSDSVKAVFVVAVNVILRVELQRDRGKLKLRN